MLWQCGASLTTEKSPLAEGRELKYLVKEIKPVKRSSPLAEGRELKFFSLFILFILPRVAPRGGA